MTARRPDTAPIAPEIAAAIARNPRLRAALARIDPAQREAARRAIAARIAAALAGQEGRP